MDKGSPSGPARVARGSPFTRPRGTRDFAPEEMERRRAVEEAMRAAAERFGYREVATPTFEHLELFTAKSGEGIVKQLYAFKDKAGRDLALRPELTAPVLRFYVSELASRPKPLKLYYVGNCFRYEEPQSGRFREFWQFGTELLGPDTPEAVAESIALADACLREAAGLRSLELRVGHIGVLKEFAAYLGMGDRDRQSLFAILDKREVEAKAEEAQAILGPYVKAGDARAHLEFLRDLASGEATSQEIQARHAAVLANLPGVGKALEALGATLEATQAMGLEGAKEDLAVVRGLDYYTGVVFEFHSAHLGAESQVCGGGVYELSELLGGEPVGSVGFAIGFDRVLLARERGGVRSLAPNRCRVYLVPVPHRENRLEALRLASELRAALRDLPVVIDVDLAGRSPAKNLKHASDLGAQCCVLLGFREVAADHVRLRDMRSGDQCDIPKSDLVPELRKLVDRVIAEESFVRRLK